MNFLAALSGVQPHYQDGDAAITGIEYDSRHVKPGSVFVAMRGESSDGNKFIDKAIASGAVAVVTDSLTEQRRPGVAWAQVEHGRRALAGISGNFYRHPANRLAITGITGTNGKSTTAFIVEAILNAANRKTALVGTIEYHVGGKTLPAPHTTPESLELNRIFASAVEYEASEVVMEVSSHALDQERVSGIRFDVAAFTNLTRDHLDYHHTMDKYFEAKRRLFQGCGTVPPRMAVLNVDDAYGQKLAASIPSPTQISTYGWNTGDFRVAKSEITKLGTKLQMVTPAGNIETFSSLIGKVNVYNVLCAAAVSHARGCTMQEIADGVGALASVPGRFERVDCGQPFVVAIDYAHTDDALRNLTALARELIRNSEQKGRVITLFGCGGDRDRSKRPLMGEAAGRGSDLVVITSDNPRSEDPISIINDALVGLQKTGVDYKIEADRRQAIALAVGRAAAGDIVLIAGKGHEKIQQTREGTRPFDDVETARQALRVAGYECSEHDGARQ